MNVTEPVDAPPNPYVGPVPFLEGQRLYGREKETDELADLLVSKRIAVTDGSLAAPTPGIDAANNPSWPDCQAAATGGT